MLCNCTMTSVIALATCRAHLKFLRATVTVERDMQVLLVTNAHPDTVAIKDAKTGLGDYFDGIHSSHDYGHAKESQDFWTRCKTRRASIQRRPCSSMTACRFCRARAATVVDPIGSHYAAGQQAARESP